MEDQRMNKRFVKTLPGLLAVAFIAVLFTSGTSHAVPAFARANKVECTTCHTIAPELNEYGEAFLKNSYVYVGKGNKAAKKATAAPAPAPVAANDAAAGEAPIVKGEGDAGKLSKLKAGAMGAVSAPKAGAATPAAATPAEPSENQAEGMILAGIPELLPISFTGSINYLTGDRRNMGTGGNDVDFAARSFKLHAAGNFRDKVGFFVTYVAYSEQETGGNTSQNPSNNKTDINEFFLQWRQALGTPINLKIGRMQPKLGLWKTNNKLAVTNEYLPYSYTVGQQSVFTIEQPQDAIELNSVLGKRFFAAAGIVNRKGQNEKDGYGHISYKFGGADYLGNEPNVDLDKEENILDYLTLTTGAYGYYGLNGKSNSPDPRNTYFRAGLDTELLYKIYRLRMLANIGEDDNVSLAVNPWTKVISKAASFEGELTLLVNLIAAARFEYLQQESASPTFNKVYLRRYVATVGYTPLENLKLSTEFKYEIGQTGINRIGTVGATFSF
jgi:Alginate export